MHFIHFIVILLFFYFIVPANYCQLNEYCILDVTIPSTPTCFQTLEIVPFVPGLLMMLRLRTLTSNCNRKRHNTSQPQQHNKHPYSKYMYNWYMYEW